MSSSRVKLCVFFVFALSCDSPPADSTRERPDERFPSLREEVEPGRTEPDAGSAAFETADSTGLAPVAVEGFEELPLDLKKLIFHYYRAVQAGDGIYYAQIQEQNARINRLLKELVAVRKKIPHKIYSKIDRYAKRFWMNRGNRDAWTGEKIIPTFIPGELAAAAQIAMNAGSDLGASDIQGTKLSANQLEELEALLKLVRPHMFDPEFEPPPEETSATDEPAPGGQIMRAGRGGVPPGLFAPELAQVAQHLRAAMELAEPLEKAAMSHLVDFVETGDRASLEEHDRLWSKLDARIEMNLRLAAPFASGPRRGKSAFKGIVALRDEDPSKLMSAVAQRAAQYDLKMPWGKRYKRAKNQVDLPSLDFYRAIAVTGQSGPVSIVDMDFPGMQKSWEPHGNKRLYLTNFWEARDLVCGTKVIREFYADDVTAERAEKWRDPVRVADLILREAIGRASGKNNPRLKGLARSYLETTVPILEELRADLVALYLAFEPLSKEVGLVPEEDCAKALYDRYATRMLEHLVLLPGAKGQFRARLRAEEIIVRYAVEKGAIEMVSKDGHFYAKVRDYAAMRAAVGELATEIQRIRFWGDVDAGNRVLNLYGSGAPDEWVRDVKSRWDALGLPEALVFVYPILGTRLDSKGEITEVVLDHPAEFTEHHAGDLKR